MMINKKFSIQKYSGMAGVFLVMGNNLCAQAVYTDIDPDIEIQFDGETAGIDMDNNGTLDFAFLKTSGTYEYETTSFTFILNRHRIWAGPEFISNEIAGEIATHGAGGGTTYFPYAMGSGDMINSGLSFQYWGFQLMAWGFSESDGDWNYEPAFWSPNIDSGYLGVRFWDDNECRHYGWIRCTTADSSKKLIIHDYAYESKCETSIKAGDIIGDTSIGINEFNSLNASIYSFNNSVYINLNESFDSPIIRIYDLSGKIVYSNEIKNQFDQIELIEARGVYVVELTDGKNKLTKKISLN
ncbi:MAG: T9SS type A sorting domain-containing protein [Chitinophagales bacterium]